MSPILRVDSIRKAFRGQSVLTCAWLTAEEGQVTMLAGRNGAGKTTLLKVAAGLLRPDRGIVIFRDERFRQPRLHQLAQLGLWWLPSRGALIPTLTPAAHAAMLAQRFSGPPPDWAGFHLESAVRTKCGELSGGERRLVDLALAIARRPACLLADEPLRGLDPKHREIVVNALLGLAARGCAVVVTGHESRDLEGLAGTVLLIERGETRLIGVGAEALDAAAGPGLG
ncbi:MAG TPA: ABC transporter ATP-binding protein [Gemmatimonadales bacterium]